MKSISEITPTYNGSRELQQSQSELPHIQKMTERYPLFNNFAEKFNPSNWQKGSQYPTKCVSCSSPTLTDINLAYGQGRAIAWLMAQLTAFQEQLNVPNKMSVFEIDTCAQTLYDNYHHLKATEFMLFFARLLGGMYPVDWHGYITPTKIVSALREHFMPWRNDLLYKITKQEEEQKRNAELHNPNNMTREEWLEIKTITAMYNSDYTVP